MASSMSDATDATGQEDIAVDQGGGFDLGREDIPQSSNATAFCTLIVNKGNEFQCDYVDTMDTCMTSVNELPDGVADWTAAVECAESATNCDSLNACWAVLFPSS
jgi:hypothetical protein